MLEHEYALLGGVSRTKVGRYLSVISASVSAVIVFLLFWGVDLARRIGIEGNLPPSILSLAGAGTVFAVLSWFLNGYAWKWGPLSKVLKIPNLTGDWHCQGQTINPDRSPGYIWEAKITIVQSWDKIRVRLRTDQSGSNSNSAALLYDRADGYRLFYSYKNEPRIDEVELKSHQGFAEITFAKDLCSGDGEYFNGHGRFTFGTMKLRRQ